MRSTIWEYLTPCPKEKDALWNSCVFVFDTNVLLNLYRYTSKTRDTLLAAFDDLKERVWLPHQVAFEFGKDRCDVIHETGEKYKNIDKLEDDFINRLTNELRLKPGDEAVIQLRKSIDSWTAEQRKHNLMVTQVSDDKILDTVLSIFDQKVGKPFSEEQMQSVCAEGKDRYEKQIPPGFCDAKKEKAGSDNNAYGDLIVWKQILEYSAANHCDIIYVTHDQKKDWWNISKGRTVGPRIELRREFAETTGQRFYMYSMDGFLGLYSEHKGKQADQNVIEEVTEIDSRENSKRKKPTTLFEYSAALERNVVNLRDRIARRQRAIASLQAKYQGKKIPPEVVEQLENTEAKMRQLQSQLMLKQHEHEACLQEIARVSSVY